MWFVMFQDEDTKQSDADWQVKSNPRHFHHYSTINRFYLITHTYSHTHTRVRLLFQFKPAFILICINSSAVTRAPIALLWPLFWNSNFPLTNLHDIHLKCVGGGISHCISCHHSKEIVHPDGGVVSVKEAGVTSCWVVIWAL